jgi:hypothetical protein
MSSAGQRWRRWLSQRERATTLALFRVLVSAILITSLLSAAWAGVVELIWVDASQGGMLVLGSGNWLVALLGGPTSRVVWSLFGVALAGACCALVGWGGRWVLLPTLQAFIALHSLNSSASGGYDGMICIALWLLLLSECNATLSVDAWRRHGRVFTEDLVAAWPRYLLILQLVVIYTATGLQKVSLTWTPMGGYTALYYVLHDPTWLRFEAEARWLPVPLLRLATAISWHWEQLTILLLPVFYFRATRGQPGKLRAAFNRWDLRLPWAVIGMALHLGIFALIDVGPFSFISLAYYVNLFTPGEIERAARALGSPTLGVMRKRTTAL